MIVTVHQPAYIPWLGYFEKIMRSDVYVFLDSVQYESRSFINRNKIKTPSGAIWLSIPVKSKGHRDSSMLDTQINNELMWKEDHLKSIYLNYKRAPRFEECYTKLEQLYKNDYELLADLCYDHLLFWLNELGVQKKIIRSRELNIHSKKSDLILDINKSLQASQYISGALGKGYLEEEKFKAENIEIIYQDYKHPVYPQLWGEFIPYMSIIDFWMNTDDVSIIDGGTQNGLV
ncbi:WbqC family protein [Brevibacillus parabrevis]|uniref:WbqC family protein n=1 Tax=Brevibacillus parabrevis TaxID=54914 RepID=UPI0028D13306|nr:WbqC family protein [Brevibacillus parabrevis]